MVLSNKKLKQKIRAKFAEISTSKTPDSEIQTNPETSKSLKQFLGSTQKPILSKREKRRANLSNGEDNNTFVQESSKGKENEVKVDENGGERRNLSTNKRKNKEKKIGVDGEIGVKDGGESKKLSDKKSGVDGEIGVKDGSESKKLSDKKSGVDVEIGGGVEVEVDGHGGESRKRKKQVKPEKRAKRENRVKRKKIDGELGVKEGDDLSKVEKKVVPLKRSKKEKKKKKKKKSKAKAEVGEEEKESMVENVVVSEQIVDVSSQVDEDDCKKVYVGGMPYSSTEDDMWSYFDHCGAITDIDCLKFSDTGKFRGIAIISFKTEEAAKKALALDGSDMDGLYLKIQPYKASRPTKSSPFTPPVIEGYNRIYAGNLAWDITEADLRKLFFDCNISAIRFGEDKETGEFKGYAHVDFADSDSLTKALKLDQKLVCGRPVKISRAVPGKGSLRNPGSIPAPPTVKPQENTSGVVPPEVKTEVNYSGVMQAAVKPEENYYEVMPPAVIPQENNSGVSAGKLKRRTCYECGERGHISSACPKKQATEQIAPNAS